MPVEHRGLADIHSDRRIADDGRHYSGRADRRGRTGSDLGQGFRRDHDACRGGRLGLRSDSRGRFRRLLHLAGARHGAEGRDAEEQRSASPDGQAHPVFLAALLRDKREGIPLSERESLRFQLDPGIGLLALLDQHQCVLHISAPRSGRFVAWAGCG